MKTRFCKLIEFQTKFASGDCGFLDSAKHKIERDLCSKITKGENMKDFEIKCKNCNSIKIKIQEAFGFCGYKLYCPICDITEFIDEE